MPTRLKLVLFSLVILMLAPTRGLTEEEPSESPPSQFREIVVYGNYRLEPHDPFTFKVLQLSSIENELYGQEPSYIFSQTPSITSYSDSGSYQGYSYFRLRGIDQTRINMTLDGVPLNEPEDQGVYFSNYPDFLSSISRLQIIRGVGTTQNGSASYAGSFLFESPELDDAKSAEIGFGAGSFDTYRTFAEYNSALTQNHAIYLRANHLSSNGYKDRSENISESLFYKIGSLEKNDTWTISGFFGQQENELAWLGSTLEEIAEDRRHNANTNENDEFFQSLVHLQNIKTDRYGNVLTSSLYYNHLEGDYDFDLNNFLGLPSNEELFNYRLKSHFLGAFSNYRINLDETYITLGLHGNLYEREHVGSERSIGELYDNTGKKNEVSGYTKLETNWADFVFLADFQLRYTNFNYAGSVSLSTLDWTFFNPKVGLTYLLSDYTNFYYGVGRTGREPTRTDILAGNDNLLSDESGQPILGPTEAEHLIDHELGVRFNDQMWNFVGNLYYMDFEEELALTGELGPNSLPLTESVDSSYRSGVELDLEWIPISALRIRTNASYNYSRIKEASETFTPVITPSWILNHGVQYQFQDLTFGTNLRYQSSSYIDFANSSRIDDAFVVDLSTHYNYADLLFGLHLNNLLNEKYFSNGYIDVNGDARYFVQAATNVAFTVTWRL